MFQMRRRKEKGENAVSAPVEPVSRALESFAIPAGDVLETLLLSSGGPVELSSLGVRSGAIDRLREDGVDLVVPLIGQGELLGALYLGPRLSDQAYSTDDRQLLGSLASQVAPAMKVAQLVQDQQAEAKEREKINQELQVAALIQQTLLPKELPSVPGWNVDAFYRPARAVGGDFYDFIDLDGGRIGVVIGDVTDKGVPAALVMATCRSMLRAAAQRHESPSAILSDVNDGLVDEIPPAMFVTCLYAVIDTVSGGVTLANAGHNLPYVRNADGVVELRATGMPLGLMSGMEYEEKIFQLGDGDVMVLTSDGITEAHNQDGEMYGFSRLMGRVGQKSAPGEMVNNLVNDLEKWTGASAEQEDDITLVVIRRNASAAASAAAFDGDSVITSFSIASEDGNERVAIERVSASLVDLAMDPAGMERLKTAVGETVMNAIEHGNKNDPDLEIDVEVLASPTAVKVKVTDLGVDSVIPDVVTPDLEAKLAGEQAPRGWGLFLIEQMVDQVNRHQSNGAYTVELIMNREGTS